MSPGVLESQADKKRLEQSLLISILIWLLLMGALALVPIRPDQIPERTMNPVYIDLAIPAPETDPSASGATTPESAAQRTSPPASTQTQPVAPNSNTASLPTASRSGASDSASRTVADRPVPNNGASTQEIRSPAVSNPYQGRGGEDPFAPLSEADLAAENPEAPALPTGPSQSLDGDSRRISGSSGSPERGIASAQPDVLTQRVERTTEGLAARGTTGVNPEDVQGAKPATSVTKGSPQSEGQRASVSQAGDSGLQGPMDFGNGPGRKLISAPTVAIPAKLLEGQPSLLETTVRFRIDKGGTVIALSIQFEPPLPLDIGEYLKTYVFSRWVFSSSNSDGQVRFKYSIKVR